MTGFDKARYNKVPFQSQVFIAALIFFADNAKKPCYDGLCVLS